MTAAIDMTGQRYGRWIAISRESGRRWLCRCDCGTVKSVDGVTLRIGKSTGCRKWQTIFHHTHGDTRSSGKIRLYRIWSNMKTRCSNPKSSNYKWYGGKGISVCADWMAYEAFKDWSEKNGYADNLTIDRRDTSGNYEPNNCRWVEHVVQMRNCTSNIRYLFRGQSLTIPEIAETIGISAGTLWKRVKLRGLSINEAINIPFRKTAA